MPAASRTAHARAAAVAAVAAAAVVAPLATSAVAATGGSAPPVAGTAGSTNAGSTNASSNAVGGRGIGIRLLDASVARRNDPRARLYIDDHLHPGTTITRHVQVSDFTTRPVHLDLYAVASSIDGAGWQVAPGRQPDELTSWMQVSPAAVDLRPGRSAVATVRIAVPVDAVAGERYATVVAELPPARAGRGSDVRVSSRVGVRVYLDVSDGGEPASGFTVSTLTPGRTKAGAPTVTAHVRNTGGRALDLGGALTLSDGPGGLRAGPYDVSVPRTLGIGASGDVSVVLDRQTPVGPWLARMTLRSGFVAHAVTARLTFPRAAGASARPVPARPVPLTRSRSVLVPVAAALLAGLLVLLLLVLLRRRRRDDDDDRAGAPTPLPPVVSAGRAAALSAARSDQ